jgi:hypothetical protein
VADAIVERIGGHQVDLDFLHFFIESLQKIASTAVVVAR